MFFKKAPKLFIKSIKFNGKIKINIDKKKKIYYNDIIKRKEIKK